MKGKLSPKDCDGVRYCHVCGQPLEITQNIYEFDDKTGEPRHETVMTCPEKRWYNHHDVRKWDADGFEEMSLDQVL
jgi:hypothetical protein